VPYSQSAATIRRRRKRRRTAITLTLVWLGMAGTFMYAVAFFQGWVGSVPSALAIPTCQKVIPVQALKPSAVTINVYNATDRPGLAASVAKSLRRQGFKIAQVANDPLSQSLSGVGQVRHGETGASAAIFTVARLSGATVVDDNRPDATVDVVLGNRFKALSRPSKVARANATRPTTPPSGPAGCSASVHAESAH
jgi:hypothetical protein